MDALFYVLAIVAFFGLGFAWVKFVSPRISKKDEQAFELMLKVIDFVTKNYQFKGSVQLATVTKYCMQALEFVETYETTASVDEKKALVKENAIDTLAQNGIEVDPEVIALVDEIIDFIIVNK